MNQSELAEELVNKPISDPNKDNKLQVVLAQQLMARLNYLAEQSGINKAELARRILAEWFEKNYEEKMRFWEQVN
jgi:hypothetical protein